LATIAAASASADAIGDFHKGESPVVNPKACRK
jgi:hypothetical protein